MLIVVAEVRVSYSDSHSCVAILFTEREGDRHTDTQTHTERRRLELCVDFLC